MEPVVITAFQEYGTSFFPQLRAAIIVIVEWIFEQLKSFWKLITILVVGLLIASLPYFLEVVNPLINQLYMFIMLYRVAFGN